MDILGGVKRLVSLVGLVSDWDSVHLCGGGGGGGEGWCLQAVSHIVWE